MINKTQTHTFDELLPFSDFSACVFFFLPMYSRYSSKFSAYRLCGLFVKVNLDVYSSAEEILNHQSHRHM